ncbi:MAG: acetyl-CoA carboxylase biotin carboxyl carrier protein [Candidatus Limnocylindrales bacterium]
MADRPARRAPAPAALPAADAAAMSRLADELLPALIARLEASTLGELEIRRNGWRVRLRRATLDARPTEGTAPRGGGRSRATADPTAATGRTAPLAAVGPGLLPKVTDRRPAALSPAVGYFSPLGSLTAGVAVRSGDVLGHVDVLGVRQDVVAPADGVVGRYLAEAGEAVEYGQELVRVEAGRDDAVPTVPAEAG